MVSAGRTLAYSSSAWRRLTLTERKPPPTGVVMGPLMAIPLRRIDSTTRSGSGSPRGQWSPRRPPGRPTRSRCRLPPARRGWLGELRPDPVAGDEGDGVGQPGRPFRGGRSKRRRCGCPVYGHPPGRRRDGPPPPAPPPARSPGCRRWPPGRLRARAAALEWLERTHGRGARHVTHQRRLTERLSRPQRPQPRVTATHLRAAGHDGVVRIAWPALAHDRLAGGHRMRAHGGGHMSWAAIESGAKSGMPRTSARSPSGTAVVA